MPPHNKHVLVISLPPPGHSGPVYELAKKLSEHVAVTFAGSGYLLDELQTNSASVLPPYNINFHRFNDGDKPDYNDVQKAGQIFLDVLYPMVTELTESIQYTGDKNPTSSTCSIPAVDAIVADNNFTGALEGVYKRGIPTYIFNTPSVNFLRWIITLSEDAPVVPADQAPDFERFRKPGEPPHPISAMMKNLCLPVKKFMPLAKGILQNSFLSIDRKGLETVKEDPLIGKVPFYFVGPLIPPPGKISGSQNNADAAVSRWLESQRSRSVIYISFGSVAVPKDEQITELATALIKLNRPFIWSLKEQAYHNLPEEMRDKLKNQFDLKNQFLVLPWAPQKAILAHPATALIISHCGWNGTLESLSAGVPMVAWPMFAEQLINAEWLTEQGVGLLIPKTGKNWGRSVPAEEIMAAIVSVAGELGKKTKFSEAAAYWANEAKLALSPGGSSETDLLRFIASL